MPTFPVLAAPTATTALTLGGISFQAFDCPEKLDYFGGGQKLVIHKFPGGLITSQDFGSFPPDAIKWSGQFFVYSSLGTIQSRVAALTQMRVNAQPVQLTFSFYTYLVRILSFEIRPQLDWWQPYDIVLIPIKDLNPWANPIGPPAPTAINGSNPSPGGTITPPPSPTGGTNLTSGISSINSPSSAGQVSNLAQQSQVLSGQISMSDNYPTVPPATVSTLSGFQQQLNNAVQQGLSGGVSINSNDLQEGLAGAVTALGPLTISPDPGQAAFSNPVNTTLGNISTSLNNSPGVGTTLTGIQNPNLNALALFYYGDASQWQSIANSTNVAGLNPGMSNIYSATPQGVYNLVIPSAPPGASAPITFTGASGVTQTFRSAN